MTNSKICLDVGGGNEPRDGFINVDLYFKGADEVSAAWDLAYPSGSVTELNCTHTLEHIEKRKIVPTLREFYRVLKPGGLLTLEVPDLAWCCANWLEHLDDGWNLDALFGNQDTPGQFHKTGFTQAILEQRLRDAGFTQPITAWQPFSHSQRCIHVEVFK